jgi:glutathione S-transferase
VWKRPPNELERELSALERAERRVRALAAELEASRSVFESLLAGRDYMLGDEFTVADCAFFPFLKYGAIFDPNDTEPFHQILIEHLAFDGAYPRLEAWVQRVNERPRA